ncbi:hypothetical protein O2V63_07140 [Modestobacter sp. VKM Ac-2977]|uniref:hypothetical protein n=1 Tax=Modestobacter sp. VKM Ac-2977 TaxID=3004131 RepID=UPI0022AB13E2|nr:hypothetical protein [Modestobacter sp. VKM Ac-2977]MCZ2820096.1 hypothetical protein [Modestobacter sp. VKM Ac-2977]
MSSSQDVDWVAVERRARLWGWGTVLLWTGWLAAIVVLTGSWALWTGRAAWVAVAAFSAIPLIGQALVQTVPAWRRSQARTARATAAVHRHVDPGSGLRSRADALARQLARNAWAPWLFLALPVLFLLDGRWERPVLAVPAAVAVVAGLLAHILWSRRNQRDARRWLTDPLGPVREPSST